MGREELERAGRGVVRGGGGGRRGSEGVVEGCAGGRGGGIERASKYRGAQLAEVGYEGKEFVVGEGGGEEMRRNDELAVDSGWRRVRATGGGWSSDDCPV